MCALAATGTYAQPNTAKERRREAGGSPCHLAQDRDRPRVGFGTWLSLHGDQRVDDALARGLDGEQQIALED